ncbi:MAG: hypothetical protein RMY64_12100 [Nostoc sp. DedQUE08]|uniref:hypothetical protein n=1 Tax=unclassified Nostoc TaxID=2593658 RepID=UPI002AD4B60E|nr:MULTISPECIES: hypothetical protein [unclassified Nostoc]MDZ8066363.1 hypothetical protein [Nostoc sp. DedQUE08]MDZ8091823.1 hypothetical protein [Nostoc sp. DedQUE05]
MENFVFTTQPKSCLAKLKSPILLLKFLLMPKFIIADTGGSIKTNSIYDRVKSALSGRCVNLLKYIVFTSNAIVQIYVWLDFIK